MIIETELSQFRLFFYSFSKEGDGLDFEKAQQRFASASTLVVLTGAGISTASGLPDFRSESHAVMPESILNRNFFFDHPARFYDYLEGMGITKQVAPNGAHQLLAEWETKGKTIHILTQNIDGLHQQAGSRHVIEFHGNGKGVTCHNPKCRRSFTWTELDQRKQTRQEFWKCDCTTSGTKRFLKPDFLLYGERGEWMSKARFQELVGLVQTADLLLVLGTSASVHPFVDLLEAKPKDTPVLLINRGPTAIDSRSDVEKFEGEIYDILQKLAKN